MTADAARVTAWVEEIAKAHAAGSQGRWFFNTYSAVTSSERARIYNEAESKLSDDSPDEDWEALPEFWVATVPVAAGDTGTRQGQADAELIVAAVNNLPALLAVVRGVAELAEEHRRWAVINRDLADRVEGTDRDFHIGMAQAQESSVRHLRKLLADAAPEDAR